MAVWRLLKLSFTWRLCCCLTLSLMPPYRQHDVVEVVQGGMRAGRRGFTGTQFVVRLSTFFAKVREVGRCAL